MTARRFLVAAAVVVATLPSGPAAAQQEFGNRIDHADGTAAVSIGHRIAGLFETRVGLDWTLARDPDRTVLPGRPVPTAAGDPSAGAAWANVTLPGFGWDRTVVEARVHPFQEQGRLGARLSRQVPIGREVAVTVESGYAVIRRFRAGDDEPAPAAVIEGSQRLGLSIRPTATTIAVSQTFSSAENQWLRAVAAEQKLFGGPVSLTATVSETAEGSLTQAVAAAFRRQF